MLKLTILQENGLENFVAKAVREKLLAAKMPPLHELEMAKGQANALLMLLVDSESHRMMEGDLNHDLRNSINSGVSCLMMQTIERLNAAFDATFDAFHAFHSVPVAGVIR